MGNVSIIKKFWKKFLNVNFDEFGLTISLNSKTIMKMMKLAIASGALTKLTLRVMSASLVNPYIKGNVLTSNQIEDGVEMSKKLGGNFCIHKG